jgi:hypothetical protein
MAAGAVRGEKLLTAVLRAFYLGISILRHQFRGPHGE